MTSVTTTTIALDQLQPPLFQPRTRRNTNQVSDLTSSIAQVGGFISALLAERTRAGGVRLITGERRMVAAREAHLPAVPVIVLEEEVDPVTRLLMMIRENTSRRDLAPVELARAVAALKLILDVTALEGTLQEEPGSGTAPVTSPRETISDWRMAYQALTAQVNALGIALRPPAVAGWDEVEEMLGISDRERKRLMKLHDLSSAVQERLLDSRLSLAHQVALAGAPIDVQQALLDVVCADGEENAPTAPATSVAASVLSKLVASDAPTDLSHILELARLAVVGRRSEGGAANWVIEQLTSGAAEEDGRSDSRPTSDQPFPASDGFTPAPNLAAEETEEAAAPSSDGPEGAVYRNEADTLSAGVSRTALKEDSAAEVAARELRRIAGQLRDYIRDLLDGGEGARAKDLLDLIAQRVGEAYEEIGSQG